MNFKVKVLQIEDLIGLKLQALTNDPKNRYAVDAAAIKLHGDRLDMGLVREYVGLFGKEALLDEWRRDID